MGSIGRPIQNFNYRATILFSFGGDLQFSLVHFSPIQIDKKKQRSFSNKLNCQPRFEEAGLWAQDMLHDHPHTTTSEFGNFRSKIYVCKDMQSDFIVQFPIDSLFMNVGRIFLQLELYEYFIKTMKQAIFLLSAVCFKRNT